jgi:hypothetical protein
MTEALYWNEHTPLDEYQGLLSVLTKLTSNATLRKSKKARVLIAQAIRRTVAHLSDPLYVDLDSPLGQWCMGSLQSSVRELRIASTWVENVIILHFNY